MGKSNSLPKGALEKLYCLSEDQAVLPQSHQDMRVHGRFDSAMQGKISLSIERCKDDCEPDEEIDRILNKANVAVYFTNHAINLKNPKNPFTKTLAGLFTAVDSEFSKTHEIFMKTANVSSDNGLISRRTKNETYFLMDYQRETVSSSRDGNLYTLVVQMSTTVEQHTRTYKKAFRFLSEIGGYLKAFVMFYYLYKPFLERKYYIEMINHLYSVDAKEKKARPPAGEDGDGNILTWRNFDMLAENKKKKKKKEMQDNLSLSREISTESNAESLDSDSNSDEEFIQPQQQADLEEEEQEILKFTLRDWCGIFLPFLRGKNHHLYLKVSPLTHPKRDEES